MVKDDKEEESASDDTGEGDKSELAKETDAANAAAERMEKATEELKAAEARRRLGGTTEAGGEAPKPPEIDNVEYAKDAMAGKLNVKE